MVVKLSLKTTQVQIEIIHHEEAQHTFLTTHYSL